jgi:putative ABC transport system permease protein
MAWLLVALRRLRDERTTAIALAALVLVTATVFAAAPRVLETVADEAIRSEIGAARAVERSIELVEVRRIDPDPRGPMDGVRGAGERLEARIPPTIEALFHDRSMLADTPRFSADTFTLSTAILRFAPGASDRVVLVAGRAPVEPSEASGAPGEPPTFEAMVSSRSAQEVGLSVGDTIGLEVDLSDPLADRQDDRFGLTIVGIYELTDPDDDWWLNDPTFSEPTKREPDPNTQFLDVSYLLAPAAYDRYLRETARGELPLSYSWRYHVDSERLSSSTADAVLGDLRRLEGIFPTAAAADGQTGYRSGLVRLVTEQRVHWSAAEVVLTVAAIGPALVAVAAIAMIAALGARRRRPALVLWRDRGASTRQVAAAAIAEGSLLAIPAALLGLAIAVSLVPGPALGTGALLAIGVGVTAVVAILVTVVAPGAADAAAARGTGTAGVRRRSGPRRLVLESLVIGLAVVGVVLLRDRGVRGSSSAGALTGADPFIAAVPVLVGIAAALIAIRAFRLATRLGAAIASGRRGFVPVFALRRSARGVGQGSVMLVLLATAAIGAFAATTLIHLDRAAGAVAWQSIGASVRIDRESGGLALRRSLGAVELPGASSDALAWLGDTTFGARGAVVDLLAVDVAAYSTVTAGTPADVGLLEVLEPLAPPPSTGGEGPPTTDPVPAIISTAMSEGRDGLEIGERFDLAVFGPTTTFVVADIRDAVPGIEPGGLWAVADLPRVDATRRRPLDPTVRFVRAADDAVPGIRAAALDSGGAGSRVVAAAERAAAIAASPSVTAVATGVAVSVIVAGAYAALALLVAMLLAGADRADEVALLRTLGLTDRQTGSLAVAEQGPTVVAAFLMGGLLGLGLFVVLQHGLGLDDVVGSSIAIPLDLDAAVLAVLLVVLGAVVVAAILIGALAGRSVSPIAVARRGLEP